MTAARTADTGKNATNSVCSQASGATPRYRPHRILCVGPDAYLHTDPDRTMRIMQYLAPWHGVLYVPSFSDDAPIEFAIGRMRRLFWSVRHLSRNGPRLAESAPGLWVLKPDFVPGAGRTVNEHTRMDVYFDIVLACGAGEEWPTLLWLADPTAIGLLDWLPTMPVVFQMDDDLPRRPYLRSPEVLRCTEALLRRADLILCSSAALFARMYRRFGRRRVRYLPHGIDADAYEQAAPDPRFLMGIPWPIAGFFGPLTRHHDGPLLERCAREAPDISFVLACPGTRQVKRLAGLPNVHRIDCPEPDRWPGLVAGFDVCLLPLRTKSWMAEADPLQFMPYMASGRPIVSTPLVHVRFAAENNVSYAAKPAEFLAAIRRELAADQTSRATARRAIACRHDWCLYLQRLWHSLSRQPAPEPVDPFETFLPFYQRWKEGIIKNGVSHWDWWSNLLGLNFVDSGVDLLTRIREQPAADEDFEL